MKKLGRTLRMIYWTVTILAMIIVVTFATYAWFTSNRTVATDTATTRTGNEELTLEISEQGAGAFSAVEEAKIVQVNQTNREYLLPVSTNNLQNFVSNQTTVENEARSFYLVENEENYYHGRVYLRASAQGMQSGTTLALYLDQDSEAGGAVVSAQSGELMNSARLGLMFNNDLQSSVIFRFGDAYNSSGDSGNTFLNGNQLGDAEVLSWNGQSAVRVADPSVTLNQYTIQMTDTAVTLPEKPLLYMEYNQIYQVDIFFYIEGCDPDCSESTYFDGGDLHLAFYGVIA